MSPNQPTLGLSLPTLSELRIKLPAMRQAIVGASRAQAHWLLVILVVLGIVTLGNPGFVTAEGGYPWSAAVAKGTTGLYWVDENSNGKYNYGEEFDANGYVYRNCTSWVGWKLASLGATNASYLGNAADWDTNAANRGIVVDTKPRLGDAAVWEATAKSPWGHVAFVERVNADGSVMVSEYNKNLRGEFRNTRVAKAQHYIHFLTETQRAVLEPKTPVVEKPKPAPAPAPVVASISVNAKLVEKKTEISAVSEPSKQPVADNSLKLSADLDGDHKSDVVTIKPNAAGTVDIAWERANGVNFDPSLPLTTSSLKNADTHWMAGDVNGDGLEDVVAANRREDGGANLVVYRSLGTQLAAPEVWSFTTPDYPYAQTTFLLGDNDGDVKKDVYLVVKTDQPNPSLYWMRSAGNYFESPKPTTK